MPDNSKEDQREVILKKEFPPIASQGSNIVYIKNAMDEYAKAMCLQLLTWMVENNVSLPDLSDMKCENGYNFNYKGEYITAKELFENFL